ncbi:MAG TPA: type I glyceraldehyde-3-phosphate dehydrogenase [Candidatus Saccharimonadales bacterium]|nr:type I glyceraldehyde-3-phosphate dehydrogenase [Candidatus Saccharimonadales bacterium]
MSTRVAINGFGRIGRSVFRILAGWRDVKLLAVNDIADPKMLAYLLKYDTVMGTFDMPVSTQDGKLVVGPTETALLAEKDPSRLPWKEMGIDVVIESTGRFRKRAEIAAHLEAGAKRVILTVPAKDEIDATIVIGVNDADLKPEHRIISNASCTTNCLAPVAKVLDEEFGILRGLMTTVHAYTNDQRLADVPHKDLRRSRAAAENIIPTTTGAAVAVGKVLPRLKGKLDGIAMRVPVPNGSVVDLVAEVARPVTREEINAAMETASRGPLKGILEYSTMPLVSSDIIKNTHSSVFDAESTQVVDGNCVKVVSWYDNEWAYSTRVTDLIDRIARF